MWAPFLATASYWRVTPHLDRIWPRNGQELEVLHILSGRQRHPLPDRQTRRRRRWWRQRTSASMAVSWPPSFRRWTPAVAVASKRLFLIRFDVRRRSVIKPYWNCSATADNLRLKLFPYVIALSINNVGLRQVKFSRNSGWTLNKAFFIFSWSQKIRKS